MDVIERLYRILRANLPPDESTRAGAEDSWDWNPVDPPVSHTSAPQSEIDPRLAAYYANLEIPYGSDLVLVRQAWKCLLKKYHPDLHAGDAQKREVANQLTAQLTNAYKELEAVLTKKQEH